MPAKRVEFYRLAFSQHPEPRQDQPVDRASGEKEWREWRCPDCGSGITKVHMGADGLKGCGKPHGYWSAEHPETGERETADLAEADLPDADTAAAEYEETKRRVIAGKASVQEAQGFIDFLECAIPNRPPEPLQDGGEREAVKAAFHADGRPISGFAAFEAGWIARSRHPHQDVERDRGGARDRIWTCGCGVRNSHHRATCIGCHQQRYTPRAPQQVIFDRGTGATLATATREGIEMLRDYGVIEAAPWPNAGLERWVLAEGIDAGDLMQLLIHPPSRGSAQ